MNVQRQYWLQLSAGQGPAECAWAVVEILRRLSEDAEASGIAMEILECVPDETGRGAKTALLRLEGDPDTEAFVQSWSGTVQWIARSPFRPQHKRKNWFVAIEAIAAQDDAQESLTIDSKSLRWEVMRASGPGGQHVNRTESAVRLTHLPTGLQVTASEERSQHRNRRLALARLSHRLRAEQERKAAEQDKLRWKSAHALVRGNPVRTFRAPG
jgi:peptide chain release factor